MTHIPFFPKEFFSSGVNLKKRKKGGAGRGGVDDDDAPVSAHGLINYEVFFLLSIFILGRVSSRTTKYIGSTHQHKRHSRNLQRPQKPRLFVVGAKINRLVVWLKCKKSLNEQKKNYMLDGRESPWLIRKEEIMYKNKKKNYLGRNRVFQYHCLFYFIFYSTMHTIFFI